MLVGKQAVTLQNIKQVAKYSQNLNKLPHCKILNKLQNIRKISYTSVTQIILF